MRPVPMALSIEGQPHFTRGTLKMIADIFWCIMQPLIAMHLPSNGSSDVFFFLSFRVLLRIQISCVKLLHHVEIVCCM